MEMFIRARRFGSLPSLSLRSLRSLPSSGGGTLQTEETKRDWRERPEGTGPKGTAGNEGKGKDWRERSDRRDAKRETIRLVPYGRCIVYIPGVSTPISDFQRLHFSFSLPFGLCAPSRRSFQKEQNKRDRNERNTESRYPKEHFISYLNYSLFF